MKRINTYLIHTVTALVLLGSLTACVEYQGPNGGFFRGNGRLAVKGTVSEATVVTRAESVESLNEKKLNTLDVFVEPVEDQGTIFKQYHLTTTTEQPIQEQVNNLLAENWRTEGLELGKNYNIYVAVNNPLTTTSDIDNVDALKRLEYNEVELGKAVIDESTNEVIWPADLDVWSSPSGEIYKQYIEASEFSNYAESGYLWSFETDKEFMMDGVIENWTPNASTSDQVFDVTLNRAAAKIVLNVKFDTDYLSSLTTDQVTITGSPRWRFYNFAFGAPVFAPTTDNWESLEVHNSATQLRSPAYNYSGNNKAFSITTYTYPCKWDSADYAEQAPSIVISVGYRQNGATTYGYYRIPLVESATTSVDRNHIYVVNATIATRGSSTQEDVTVTEDIEYKVLPWNDSSNSDVIENNVQSVQHYYFNVNPKVYTLRGDGNQSIVLNYSKATGTKVNWKLFTYDDDGNQTGVVANNNDNAVRAWFYNSNGAFTAAYNDNSGTDWSDMGVDIVQSTEVTSGSKGTITVTSKALNNKAIKYIRLRVYLDEKNDQGQSLEGTYHEDIIIRHFPTDNIQNIEGLWSSYTGASSKTTLTTRDLAEAEAWATQYGVDYQSETRSDTEYIDYATYSANASDTEHYHMEGPTATTSDVFQDMVSLFYRQYANSQENAVADGGEGHSYYWGLNVQTVATNVRGRNVGYYDYDYYIQQSNGRYDLYKYQNYYYATYTRTSDPYTLYSVTYTTETPSTWVDWETDPKTEATATSSVKLNYDGGNFFAKVYNSTNGNIYPIVVSRTGGNPYRYYYTRGTSQYSNVRANTPSQTYTQVSYNGNGLNNNHMYVIQISSTSNDYVLGRPYVNESTHQSQDNVVSPAFMIASQLGAVQVFTGNNAAANAAEHCSRYMEVTEDGVRYTGWRLPTQSEIAVITRYQNGTINGVTVPAAYRTMTAVLTGDRYWCLSGQKIQTSNSQPTTQGNAYLRCVRDLSAKEVEELNGFDKIQEKYR